MSLTSNRLIAAMQDPDALDRLLASPVQIVFLRIGDIETLTDSIRVLQRSGRRVFVQVDLIRGLSTQKEATSFVVRQAKPDGIVTTRLHSVRLTQSLGLPAVLHNFVIDTGTFRTAVESVNQVHPDAFYLMPGVMPRVIHDFRAKTRVPLIVGGLFSNPRELRDARDAGADAVVAGSAELWDTVVE